MGYTREEVTHSYSPNLTQHMGYTREEVTRSYSPNQLLRVHGNINSVYKH